MSDALRGAGGTQNESAWSCTSFITKRELTPATNDTIIFFRCSSVALPSFGAQNQTEELERKAGALASVPGAVWLSAASPLHFKVALYLPTFHGL
jgi:hypothetical protein